MSVFNSIKNIKFLTCVWIISLVFLTSCQDAGLVPVVVEDAEPIDLSSVFVEESAVFPTPTISAFPTPRATQKAPTFATFSEELPVGTTDKDWQLIFEDEFRGTELNDDNWTTCLAWSEDGIGCSIATNNELQWYQPDNVFIRDGAVILQGRELDEEIDAANGRSYTYTSGMISTGRSEDREAAPIRFAFTYGYIEMHAYTPSGKGLWPAFWLLPVTHEWPPEIDIFEIIGDKPDTAQFHAHYLVGPQQSRSEGFATDVIKLSEGTHTYAVDWQPDYIAWYIDGQELYRTTKPEAIPQEPMYILANLAIGGDWPGAPDDYTVFPTEFGIDYVRVWQK